MNEIDESARLLRKAEKAKTPERKKELVKLAREWRFLADVRAGAGHAHRTGFRA